MHARTRFLSALAAAGLCAGPAGAATFAVTSNADSGPGTLRASIAAANATPGADTITFNLAAGQRTIALASSLPTVTAPLDINGTSQPGYAGVPLIRVDGVALSAGHDALRIDTTETTVRGLMVTRAPGGGIVIQSGFGHRVHSNYVGTDGSVALGNGTGVRIDGGALVTIGDSTAGRHNVISGNLANGISVDSDASFNQIVNNRIGTNAAGTAAVPNGYAGIRMFGDDNGVHDNLISGNARFGVEAPGHRNGFYGNRIGTNLAGTAALPNLESGVAYSGDDLQFGGLADGAGNLVSGNGGSGLSLSGNGASLAGNRIGTNAAGTAAIPNVTGVRIFGADAVIGGESDGDAANLISGNTVTGLELSGTGAHVMRNLIGTNAAGTAAIGNGYAGVQVLGSGHRIGSGNLVSGNGNYGIQIGSDASDILVQGNYIGVGFDGVTAVPNDTGVSSSGEGVTIGGGVITERNVIAGNSGSGVVVGGSNVAVLGNHIGLAVGGTALGNGGTGLSSHAGPSALLAGNVISNNGRGIEVSGPPTLIQGNTIGLNIDQTAEMRNGGASGIALHTGGHQVGGTESWQGNVIVASWGIVLTQDSDANIIEGNFIGTNAAQTQVFGSGYSGINLYRANANTIGGVEPGAGNVIRGAGFGVYVALGTGNAVLGNSIAGNDLAGIELDPIGPSGDDALDADHGPNEGQNRPVLTSAQELATDVFVNGTLQSRPNRTYRVELFHSASCHVSGLGEGDTPFGVIEATTDATGKATLAAQITNGLGAGVLTATATDADGNTSEFSPCIDIGMPHPGRFTLWRDPYLAYEDVETVTVHVLRSGGLVGNASVRLRTVDDSAVAPADYTARDLVLNFGHGEWIRTVEIPVKLDADSNEGTENFDVELSAATGGAVVSSPSTDVLLFDHAPSDPFLSIDPIETVDEPASGQATVAFTIRLSPTDHAVAVGYETFDGTATAGADYVATQGLVAFQPGQRTKTVQVPVLADNVGEIEETFHLRLIAQGDPLIAYTSEGQASIVDADGGPDAVFRDGFE